MIDLTPLQNALKSLKKAVDRSIQSPEDEEFETLLFKRFEYSYELSWKMLKRRLKEDAASPEEIDRMPFKDPI